MKYRCNGLYSVLILNLIFCSLVFAKQIPYKEAYTSKETPTIIDAKTILQLYQLMKDVHEVFISKNIKYWAIGGTLLGAARHHGIIPWDDDLDICIDKNQEVDFIALKPIFKQLKYDVVPCFFGYQIFPQNNTHNFKDADVCLDVCLYKQNGNKISYGWKKAGRPGEDKGTLIYSNELLPMKDYKFGNFFIKGPKEPLQYLICCYGKKCMDEANFGHVHGKNIGKVKKGTIKLTKKDKVPAMPTGPLEDRVAKILESQQFSLETIQITQNNLVVSQGLFKKICPIYVAAFEKESEAQLEKEHLEEYNELKRKGLTIRDVLLIRFNKMIDVFVSQIDSVKESYISIVKNDNDEITGYSIFIQAPISQTLQSMVSRNYITSVISLPTEIFTHNNTDVDDLYILSIAVHPSFQKQGLGKKLILPPLTQCSKAKNIYLLTAASEQNKDTQEFYEHLNFKRKGIVLTADNNQKILYSLDNKH